MLHQFENREDLELHLKQNGKKFGEQCVELMKAMYKGRKLNSMIVEREFLYNSRRLRDCREGRPDIVKSCWVTDADGKTKYVQYWIDIPPSPTKQRAIAEGQKILDAMNDKSKQGELF